MSKTCHNCGRETMFENVVFCPHCGKMLTNDVKDCSTSERISIVNEIENPCSNRAIPPLISESSEKSASKNICPVCCTIVEEKDESITCPDCKIKYHKDCWIDNDGCATYGCPSSGCLAPPPPSISPSECDEALHDNIEDATAQSYESIICPHCQTKLSSNTSFCWNCGKELPDKQIESRTFEQSAYSSPIQSSTSTNCSFGKIALAGTACVGYLLVIFLIFYAISGNSMAKGNIGGLGFLIVSGCSMIWKSITGEK